MLDNAALGNRCFECLRKVQSIREIEDLGKEKASLAFAREAVKYFLARSFIPNPKGLEREDSFESNRS